MNEQEKPRVMPPDEIDLFKKQRDLSLPAARITLLDEFAKWMFTVVAFVGTLGAAFSNTSFQKLSGFGLIMFSIAISLSGTSLAVAVVLRTIEPANPNWNSLPDMLKKGNKALKIKRVLAWIAGITFA